MSWSDKNNHAVRFFPMPNEQGEIKNPIQGYQNMPLVTLEKAVEPLVSIVNDIENMVGRVKSNCSSPPDSLSPDESASIMLYTLHGEPEESSFYCILNKNLRSEDRHELKPWFLYLKLFLTALSKLTSKRRTLHRGIKKDIRADYPTGKTFFCWAFTSCTSSPQVLEKDDFLGKTGIRTLLNINCYSGKDIHEHSMYKNEDEILLPAGCQLKVVGSMNAGNDLSIIYIEEIDPLNPLLESLSSNTTSASVINITDQCLPNNETLEEIIRQCQSQNLNLSGKQLNDQDMKIVVTKGIIDKQCTVLNLMCNQITPSGVSILANALRNNKKLEELIISHDGISDTGVRFLSTTMNTSILKRIDLTENNISDEGVKYLAEMLTTNTNLLQLKLEQNQIGNAGVTMLAKVLAHENTHLQILNLNINKKINDESIDTLIDMMEHNRSLKKLDLRHCALSKDGEIRLQKVAKLKKGFQIWLSYVM